MAKLKITEVSGKINTGNVPDMSGLNLPLSLATAQGAGFKSLGQAVTKLYGDQKAEADNLEADEITSNMNVDLIQNYNSFSKGTNLKTALEGFTQSNKYENYKNLGSNKQVKRKVKKYLSDFNREYSLKLLGEVTKRNVEQSKVNKEDKLDSYIKAMSGEDTTAAAIASKKYNSFFLDPENDNFYGASGLKKLKKQKDQLKFELTLINGGKKGKIDLLDNDVRKSIIDKLGPQGSKAIIENIRQSGISLQLEEEANIKERDRQDKQSKITNYTGALLAINDHRLNPSSETKSKVPSLNDLYDLRQADKINSAQYENLINIYANGGQTFSDPQVQDLVNSQLALAETVEEFDALQESANLDKEIVSKLSPESQIKLNSLIDKYKEDRTFSKEHKKFTNLLKINTKKIKEVNDQLNLTAITGGVGSVDTEALVETNARLDEYNDLVLNKNFTPEQAYEKVLGELEGDKLPKLKDLQKPQSVSFDNFEKAFEANPKNAFITMRDDVAAAYKEGGSIQQFKDDLRLIDQLEDVFDVRVSVFGTEAQAIKGTFKKKDE